MGLFDLIGKSKEEGWDEDAATEFHNKAPAAKRRSVSVATIGDVQNGEGAKEIHDGNLEVEECNHLNNKGSDEVASPSVQAENRTSVVFATPISSGSRKNGAADQPDIGIPVKKPPTVLSDHTSIQQFLESYSREADGAVFLGKGLANYLSDLFPLVQSLNAMLEECQKESAGLINKLTSLRAEIDAFEESIPTFDTTLRELVNNLNEELTKDSVEGVERVEVPKYATAADLLGIISMTGNKFSKMMPALEKSRDGALKMLQTLKPESKAFFPTKELVDFSTNGIECVNRFLNQIIELIKRLDGSIKNCDLLSTSYRQTLAESEVNLEKIAELVESIKIITEAFRRSGDRLREILSP
jgi:hypothetical protein